ncbi:permease [Paenibacillus rhizovicinus]|uniref:Permease n=1 Tax=Paenibacillus rhizovicinus TaxID=2704463 RepID=A0A6C0NYQ4_9BACL|nr:metal-dependent hydrolase [Paenibacillus rhizovicinus]QHW31251.1 permease [Paenibacillus rhizovicinus]
MFAGHFGLAAAVKAKDTNTPVWALMLGTQLLDVIFVPLFVTGKETIIAVGGDGYGGGLIHANYTHSLAGAVVISLLALWLGWRIWSKRSGIVIGLVVFSHWLLDLIVHRPDLPILPGNAGHLPLLGFGLWQHSAISAALEAAMIAGGFLLYFRSAVARSKSSGIGAASTMKWAYRSSAAMGLLLLGSLLTDTLLGG